jgi:hypothetical protein
VDNILCVETYEKFLENNTKKVFESADLMSRGHHFLGGRSLYKGSKLFFSLFGLHGYKISRLLESFNI